MYLTIPPSNCAALRQLIEQRLGFLQVLRRKALGEPAVNGREELVGFTRTCLVAHQPRITGRGAQLPRFRPLRSRPVERGDIGALGPCRIVLQREKPAPDAERFGLTDAEWALVEPMIPPAKRGGRRREVN